MTPFSSPLTSFEHSECRIVARCGNLSIRTCRAQAAHETVVDAAEQLLFFVRDEDNCKLRQAVEIVNDARASTFVDLIEHDDSSRILVLLVPLDEFVVGADWRWMSIVAPMSLRIWYCVRTWV